MGRQLPDRANRLTRGLGPALSLALVLAASAGCGHAGARGRADLWGSGKMADVAERSLPAVVNVSTTRLLRGRSPFLDDPLFRHFFRIPRARRQRSLGSGVIVDRSGIVLTNNHVVAHAAEIRVTLSDGRELAAELVGADPKSDVAVLRLKGKLGQLSVLPLGDSAKLRLGEVVLAIGNPFGVGQTVTFGIVSAKGRANMGIVDYEDFIQTDAAINPGNSGGALVNLAGELVGINTAILSRSGGTQGIGFAIPVNMARPIMTSLLARGTVVRGWLGVALQPLQPELARALGLPDAHGVLVGDVTDGSPAARAGIRRGDVIQRINGEAVRSPRRLRNLLAAAGADASVTLDLLRGAERLSLKVKLAPMPTTAGGVARLRRGQGALGGLTVVGLSPAVRDKHDLPGRLEQGVVVEQVLPGGAAAQAGLRPGDVLLEINRQPVQSVQQFEAAYAQSPRRLLLLVYRGGATTYLLLDK